MEKTYKILKLLIWVLLFAVLIAGAYVLYNRLSSQVDMDGLAAAPEAVEEAAGATEEEPRQVPDFTVYDIDGNPVSLSDFYGKPILLNFWASWCGPCVMEMPEFQKFYESYGDRVQFVIVNLTDGYQETVESSSEFVAEQGYTFPVYYDTDIDAARKYGVNAVPVSYFIDAEGHLVTWRQGMLTADLLQQGMDLLLAEE